jgi:hypothetical protein
MAEGTSDLMAKCGDNLTGESEKRWNLRLHSRVIYTIRPSNFSGVGLGRTMPAKY